MLSSLLVLLGFGAVVWVMKQVGPPIEPGHAASTQQDGYARKAWPHWSDADHDCQDTRQEVLITESEVPVKFKTARRCKVVAGRWRDPYTGRTFTDPRKLDVDHMVPLAEAHRAGGHAWNRRKRRRYANSLDHPEHLVAVQSGANRSKADKGPEDWMPPAEGYRCEYLRAWRGVKERWSLQLDPRERSYVKQAEQACGRGEVPALPAAQQS